MLKDLQTSSELSLVASEILISVWRNTYGYLLTYRSRTFSPSIVRLFPRTHRMFARNLEQEGRGGIVQGTLGHGRQGRFFLWAVPRLLRSYLRLSQDTGWDLLPRGGGQCGGWRSGWMCCLAEYHALWRGQESAAGRHDQKIPRDGGLPGAGRQEGRLLRSVPRLSGHVSQGVPNQRHDFTLLRRDTKISESENRGWWRLPARRRLAHEQTVLVLIPPVNFLGKFVVSVLWKVITIKTAFLYNALPNTLKPKHTHHTHQEFLWGKETHLVNQVNEKLIADSCMSSYMKLAGLLTFSSCA